MCMYIQVKYNVRIHVCICVYMYDYLHVEVCLYLNIHVHLCVYRLSFSKILKICWVGVVERNVNLKDWKGV